jgi:hypothetical protein
MGITTTRTQRIIFATLCGLWAALYSPLAHAQTPPCSIAGHAGNFEETCAAGFCEGQICNGSAYVTLSARNFSGWESVKFGNDTSTCNSGRSGRLRYAGGSTWEYCNGTAWTAFGGGGSISWPQSVTSATGGDVFQIASSQNFLGFSTDSNNTSVFLGRGAGNAAETIGKNTFIGYFAGGSSFISGIENTAIGYTAGQNLQTATDNVFIGSEAGANTSLGSTNVFIGSNAGFNNTTGNNNTYVGYAAGMSGNSMSASSNTFVGFWAGRSNTSDSNTFIGLYSGQSNTTGTSNTFLGRDSGSLNTTGSHNIIIGSNVSSTPQASESLNIGHAIYGTLNDGDGARMMNDNDSELVIDGIVKIGERNPTCNATYEGYMRYNNTTKKMQYCNATAWTDM